MARITTASNAKAGYINARSFTPKTNLWHARPDHTLCQSRRSRPVHGTSASRVNSKVLISSASSTDHRTKEPDRSRRTWITLYEHRVWDAIPLGAPVTTDEPAIDDLSLRGLFDYWQSKRRGRFAPSRPDIKPEELTFILPSLYLVDVVGSPRRFRYRLVGTGVVKEYGAEITGKFVDEIAVNENRAPFLLGYEHVAVEGKPASTRGAYTKTSGRRMVFEHLILPLSTDGQMVDMLLAAVIVKGRDGSKAWPR